MSPPHYVEGDELRDELWPRVRQVLMEQWDPIGVCGEPNATNEYDSYIPKIKALIRAGVSVGTIVDQLDGIATERMGFTSHPEICREAAESLAKLRVG